MPVPSNPFMLNLSVQVYLSKQIFFVLQGCRQQTLGITQKFLSFLKDAICILIGFSRWYCLGNAGVLESLYVKSVCPSLLEQVDFFFCVVRMPLADFRDYAEIPLFP